MVNALKISYLIYYEFCSNFSEQIDIFLALFVLVEPQPNDTSLDSEFQIVQNSKSISST